MVSLENSKIFSHYDEFIQQLVIAAISGECQQFVKLESESAHWVFSTEKVDQTDVEVHPGADSGVDCRCKRQFKPECIYGSGSARGLPTELTTARAQQQFHGTRASGWTTVATAAEQGSCIDSAHARPDRVGDTPDQEPHGHALQGQTMGLRRLRRQEKSQQSQNL